MVSRVFDMEGCSQLLLPAGLQAGSITAQGCGLLPLLNHLVAGLAPTGALDCHLHQRPCLPAAQDKSNHMSGPV